MCVYSDTSINIPVRKDSSFLLTPELYIHIPAIYATPGHYIL